MIATEDEARAFTANLCDDEAMARLEQMAAMLLVENQEQNLISRPSEKNIWQRHIADSAQLLSHVPRETSGPWLDLGTGAGFPGLVIAAMRPQMLVILVESRRRRVEWLERVKSEIGLSHCRVEGVRLELLEPFKASTISARAFAPLPKLLRLSAPFSTAATRWVLPKGRSAAQELAALPRKQRAMFHVEQSLTDQDAGIIVST